MQKPNPLGIGKIIRKMLEARDVKTITEFCEPRSKSSLRIRVTRNKWGLDDFTVSIGKLNYAEREYAKRNKGKLSRYLVVQKTYRKAK